MTPASRRVVRASLLLLVLLAGVAGLAFAPSVESRDSSADVLAAEQEPARLTAAQGDVFEFFNDGRAAAGSGRGLFETDFFKPAPAPTALPAPVPAPAPPPRNIALVYRGLASFPGGASVAYVTVDGRVLTLAPGEAVTEGWRLLEFDADKAVLAKGGERLTLSFNRAGSVRASKP